MSFIEELRMLAQRPSIQPPALPIHGERGAEERRAEPRDPRETVELLKSVLDRYVFGQEKLKTLLIACLASGVDLLVVSPPGEAKTYTVDVLAAAIEGCRYFRKLMTFDTTVFDIVGYPLTKEIPDASGAKTIVLEPDLSSGISEANIVLFDEVFKAPGLVGVLLFNAMALRAIEWQKRRIELRNLWLVVGLSNPREIEEKLGTGDPVFEPLFDRFVARLWMQRTPVEQIEAILDVVYKADPSDPRCRRPRPVVTVRDVEVLRAECDNLVRRKYERYRSLLMKVLYAAARAQIDVSPRKAVMLLRLIPGLELAGVKGFGAKVAYLQHALASSQDEAVKLGEVIVRELRLDQYDRIEKMLREAEEEIARKNFGNAEELLVKVERLAGELQDEDDRETYMEVVRRLRETIARSLSGSGRR